MLANYLASIGVGSYSTLETDMSKLDELIVVAPRRLVFDGEANAFHGFLDIGDARAERILAGLCARAGIARRGDVEEDVTLLQPIPYVLLARENLEGEQELFAYTRLVGGGERRLHGRTSIGVGGHMNRAFDRLSLAGVIVAEAERELVEELSFRDPSGREVPPPTTRLLGLINDDTGAVQRVHIGLLAIVEVPPGWQVQVRETERLEGRWIATEALAAGEMQEGLEEWSIHALAALRHSP